MSGEMKSNGSSIDVNDIAPVHMSLTLYEYLRQQQQLKQQHQPTNVKDAKFDQISVTSIEKTHLELSYVLCTNGTECEKKKGFVGYFLGHSDGFNSAEELNEFLENLRQDLLEPKLNRWFYQDATLPISTGLMLLNGVLTHGFGADGIASLIGESGTLLSLITSIFGSTETFAMIVMACWYGAIGIHFLEMLALVYICVFRLQLRPSSTVRYAILTLLTGLSTQKTRQIPFTWYSRMPVGPLSSTPSTSSKKDS